MPTCKGCQERFGLIELRDGYCKPCRSREAERADASEMERLRHLRDAGLSTKLPVQVIDEKADTLVATTGELVPGRTVSSIVSIVGAEAAIGMNILKDIANNWRDAFGGRSTTVQKYLERRA